MKVVLLDSASCSTVAELISIQNKGEDTEITAMLSLESLRLCAVPLEPRDLFHAIVGYIPSVGDQQSRI